MFVQSIIRKFIATLKCFEEGYIVFHAIVKQLDERAIFTYFVANLDKDYE